MAKQTSAPAKKIALVTTREGSVSGVAVFMDVLARELQARGYIVDLLRPERTQLKEIPQIGYVLEFALMREKLRTYDLVVGNGIGLAGAVDLDTPVVYNMHSNSVAGNLALRQAFDGLTYLERHMLNKILSRFADLTWRQLPEVLTTNKTLFKIDALLAQRANRLIAVSPMTARNAIDHFGVPKSKVATIYNAVDEVWFNPREYNPLISEHKVNVVFAGRMVDSPLIHFLKGFDRVVGSLSNMRKAHPVALMHIGSTDRQNLYEEFLAEHKIDARYNLSNEELVNYLRPGDIFLMTSRSESFSLSLAEAMASGMAPVVFSTGIVPDVIESGKNGFIVSTIEEMRQRISQLADDKELREEMGRQAQKTAKKYFTLDRMVAAYCKEFDKLLAR
jgi:glycosyltransferase involved in cell wall biosynthesis